MRRGILSRCRWPSPAKLSLVALVSFLGLCLRLGALGAPPQEEPHYPVPIHRLAVTQERLAEELKAHKQGVLVELSRKSFEEKVRAAAEAQQNARTPPRLLESHYRAFFEPAGLHGTAQWKVVHTVPSPGILPLASFNLAIVQARIDNADALLGDLDGNAPGLFVEKKGEHLVTMDWTSRVEARPEGFQIEMDIPPAPIGDLELYVPRDREIAEVTDGCIVTGPHPSDHADHFLWRIQFSHRGQLHFLVRRSHDPEAPQPLVRAQVRSVCEIQPDFLEAEFNFDFKVLHRGVRQLRVLLDAGLDVTSVSLAGMEGYAVALVKPPVGPPAPNGPKMLTIQMREEARAGTLRIGCRGPLVFSTTGRIETWTAPAAGIVGSVAQGESISVHVSSEITLEAWQNGNFRMTESGTLSDGSQRIVLEGGALDADIRPSTRLVRLTTEYRARQQTFWHLRSQGSSLVSQFQVEMNRGRLQHIPLSVPADWEVDQVETTPGDLLSSWRAVPEGNASILHVNLKRLLSAALPGGQPDDSKAAAPSSMRLTVHLRPAARKGGESSLPIGVPLTIPDLAPLKARWREGGLGIEYDETLYQARINPPPSSALGGGPATAPADEDGPWGKQLPDHYLPFRGEPFRGTLTLTPHTQRLRANCASAVFLDSTSRKAAVQMRVALRLDAGNLDTLELTLSTPLSGRWEARDWKSEDGRAQLQKVEHLPSLELPATMALYGCGLPMETVSLSAWRLAHADLLSRTERWRMTFAQPLGAAHPVVLVCELIGDLLGRDCTVPLPGVEGAASLDGEVKVFLSGVNVGSVEQEGLTEQSSAGRSVGPVPWRNFRYASGPVRLSLNDLALAADRTAEAGADNISLTTYVEPSGRLLHHYRFDLWSRHLRAMPLGVSLPRASKLLAVRIDGEWQTQIAQSATSDSSLSLPMPVLAAQTKPAPVVHSYELIYSTEGGRGGLLWQHLRSPAPELSVRGTSCRRIWCLAPGMVPLHSEKYRRLPSPRQDGTESMLAAAGLAPGNWRLPGAVSESEAFRLRQLFRDGGRAVSANFPEATSLTFGTLLERIVSDYLTDQPAWDGRPIVIDGAGMAEARLAPATPVPLEGGRVALAWMEKLDLALVSGAGVTLLTTQRRVRSWEQSNGLPAGLVPAIEQAAAAGQDASARFQILPVWTASGATLASSSPDDWLPAQFGDDWTEWEVLGDEDESLLLVHSQGVPAAGIALAVVLWLAFVAAVRWRHSPARAGMSPAFLVLMISLALCGVGVLWLPRPLVGLALWPLANAALLALGWYARGFILGRRVLTSSRSPSTMVGAPAAVSAALVMIAAPAVLVAVLSAHGEEQVPVEPRPPATVFLLPETSGEPAKQRVLAPQDLLAQLDELARAGPPGLQDAVLTSVQYNGEVRDGEAIFRAAFKAHCFRDADKGVILTIPLSGVQLDDDQVLLDGARTAPIAVGRPPTAWQFLVKGRGLHRVELQFRVPIQRQRDEADIDFRAPSLLQSELKFAAPAGSYYLHARGTQAPARGGQHVDYMGTVNYVGRLFAAAQAGSLPALAELHAQPTEAVVLHADLGRLVSPLRIRWSQVGEKPHPSRLELREGYLWTFRPQGSSLTALLQYRIDEGSLPGVEFDLPPDLEVEAIEASVLPERTPLRLRDWRLRSDDRDRKLEVEFTRPARGEIEIELHLLRAHPPNGAVDLVVPAPVLPTTVDLSKGDHLFAYHVGGMEVKGLDLRGAVRADPAKFHDLWTHGSKGSLHADDPHDVFTFRRRSGDFVVARLQLQMAPTDMKCVQDVSWRVGASFADFKTVCKLKPGDDDICQLEWDVPASLQITQVSGKDVRCWSRTGTRLQASLDQPRDDRGQRGEIVFTLLGWQKNDVTPGNQFHVAGFRLLGVPAQENVLHVIPAPGIVLERVGTGVAPAVVPGAGQIQWDYRYTQLAPKAAFAVRRRADLEVTTLTILEVSGSHLLLKAIVDCQARQGELHSFGVQLQRWPGDEVHLEAPRLLEQRERRREPGSFAWNLDLQPGVKGHYRVLLTGAVPLDRLSSGLTAPVVVVDEADPEGTQAWLVAEEALLTAEPKGLVGQTAADAQAAWPAEKAQLHNGKHNFWKATDKDWSLLLIPRSAPAVGHPLELALAEHVASVPDGRHWTHQSTYWLYHESNSDLVCKLPAQARVLAVAIDGHEVSPLQPSPERLWIPVAGVAGALRLEIRWQADPAQESLDKPDMEAPILEGAEIGRTTWSLYVPGGYHVEAGAPGGSAQSSSRVELNAARARALLELAQHLAPRVHDADDPAAAQFLGLEQEIVTILRRAECELAVSERSWHFRTQAQASWKGDIEGLKKENVALCSTVPVLDALRLRAERGETGEAMTLAPTALSGTPRYWQVDEREPVPAVRLAPDTERHHMQTMALSLLLAAFLGVVLLCRPWQRAQLWLSRTWPEQLLALAVAAWFLHISYLSVLLLVAGALARLTILLLWLGRKAPRTASEPDSVGRAS